MCDDFSLNFPTYTPIVTSLLFTCSWISIEFESNRGLTLPTLSHLTNFCSQPARTGINVCFRPCRTCSRSPRPLVLKNLVMAVLVSRHCSWLISSTHFPQGTHGQAAPAHWPGAPVPRPVWRVPGTLYVFFWLSFLCVLRLDGTVVILLYHK